jgi:hypothetical protein
MKVIQLLANHIDRGCDTSKLSKENALLIEECMN